MNILIVGFGSIGQRHQSILKSLYPLARIDVVSRHCQKTTGFFNNLEEVETLQFYDYFLICSETYLHHKHFMYINSRVSGKKIFIEKPIFNIGDTPIEISMNTIFVGYNLRFHPMIMYMKESIKNRRVLSARIQTGQYLPTWRSGVDYRKSYSASCERGGGVLMDLSHELDYASMLFGRIIELHAINRRISSLEIDTDDVMYLIGLTDSNVILNISLDYLNRIPERRINVQCNDATFIADLITLKFTSAIDNKPTYTHNFSDVQRNDSYIAMHRAILEGVGLDVCRISEAIYVLRAIELVKESESKDWKHE